MQKEIVKGTGKSLHASPYAFDMPPDSPLANLTLATFILDADSSVFNSTLLSVVQNYVCHAAPAKNDMVEFIINNC